MVGETKGLSYANGPAADAPCHALVSPTIEATGGLVAFFVQAAFAWGERPFA